jgi:hypothetical protein
MLKALVRKQLTRAYFWGRPNGRPLEYFLYILLNLYTDHYGGKNKRYKTGILKTTYKPASIKGLRLTSQTNRFKTNHPESTITLHLSLI